MRIAGQFDEEDNAPPPCFPLRAIADIPEIVQQEFLVEGLIPRYPDGGTAGYLFGPEKARKSLQIADLALSIATGTPAFGQFEVKKPGSAVLFFAEDPAGETSRRVHRMARARGLSVPRNLHLIDIPALQLDNLDHQDRLANTLQSIPDLAFGAFDPMIRMHSKNDNRAEEIGPIHTYLRGLSRSIPGATFLLAHHTNKGDGSARGSSDYPAFGDFNIYLRKADEFTTEVTRIENRGGPPLPGFRLTVEDGFVEDQGATMKLVYQPKEEGEARENERDLAIEEAIVAYRESHRGARGRACQDHLKSLGLKVGSETFWRLWKGEANGVS